MAKSVLFCGMFCALGWSDIYGFELSGGAGVMQGYQYGVFRLVNGQEMRERFDAAGMIFVSGGMALTKKWGWTADIDAVRFGFETAVDDGRGAVLRDRFALQLYCVSGLLRVEKQGSNGWVIHAGAGPAVVMLLWNDRLTRGDVTVGTATRRDVALGASVGVGLKRQVRDDWFFDVRAGALMSGSFRDKALGSGRGGFEGLRQGRVELGIGKQWGEHADGVD